MLLEETLIHKQKRYNEQKRITGNNRAMYNSEIASKIAAATGMDLPEDRVAETQNCGTTSTVGDHLAGGGAAKRRLLDVRLVSHFHEHSAKIMR